MTGKWISGEHGIKSGVEFVGGDFPCDEGSLGEVGRKKGLPDSPDCPGFEHGTDTGCDLFQREFRPSRDLREGLAVEPCDLILRDFEDAFVDGVGTGRGQHGKEVERVAASSQADIPPVHCPAACRT